MALALDASTPAIASAGALTVTTASFTPPAGAVLYAIAMHDMNSGVVEGSSTISDTAGLTWTDRGSTNDGNPHGSLTRLWTATVATSAAMTATITTTSNGFSGIALRLLVMTGADVASPVEGFGVGRSFAAEGTFSQPISASDRCWPWFAGIDYNTPSAAFTPDAGTTEDFDATLISGGGRFYIGYGAPRTAGGTSSLGASNTDTTHSLRQWIGFAIRPAGSLFTTQVPGIPNVFENQTVSVATTLQFAANGTIDGGRFYAPSTVGSGTFELALYQVTADDSPAASGTGTLLATATFGTLVPAAWNFVNFSSPVSVSTGVAYRITVRTSEGRYTATGGFFNSAALTNGSITANQTGTNPVGIGNLDNGSFIETITTYPNKTFNGNAYFVDVTGFTPGSGTTDLTLTSLPAGSTPAGSRDDLYSAFALRSRPAGSLARGAVNDFTLGTSTAFTLASLPAGSTPAGSRDALNLGAVLASLPAGSTPAGTRDTLTTGLTLATLPASALPAGSLDAFVSGLTLATLPAGSLPAGSLDAFLSGLVLTSQPAGTTPAGAVDTFTAGAAGAYILASLPAGSLPAGSTADLAMSAVLLSLPAGSLPAGAQAVTTTGLALFSRPGSTFTGTAAALFTRNDVLRVLPASSLPRGSATSLVAATPGGATSSPTRPIVSVARERVITTVSRDRILSN